MQSLPRALEENEEEAVYLQGCVPPGPPGRGPVLLTTSRVPPTAQDPTFCPPREVATWPVSTASATLMAASVVVTEGSFSRATGFHQPPYGAGAGAPAPSSRVTAKGPGLSQH